MSKVSRMVGGVALGVGVLLTGCASSQGGAEAVDRSGSSIANRTANPATVARGLQPEEKALIRAALATTLPSPERMKLRFAPLRLPVTGNGVTPYCGTYAIFHVADPLYTGGPYRLTLKISEGKVVEVTEVTVVPPSLLEKGMFASLPAITSAMRTCSKEGYDLKRQTALVLE